ncbi:MAG: hypothetical protein QNJ12_06555 [Ilumatobacter sp.]|uniref:hypothetical protein n=1 Tax=Ilumatobacter sp. TaxID=1967498 RepID=UPI0026119C96|nr:hypothetical protein [Ilumatobacter sp.]MDJ0768435.1 hypothetical protein [Ilumatobacter sp.]
MWRLISTWDRDDGSTTTLWYTSNERSFRRRLGLRRRGWQAVRPRRSAPGRRAPSEPVAERVIAALGPTIERHGITPAAPQEGDSVVWCSPSSSLLFVDDDPADAIGPHDCTDLWVHVDQTRETIAVDLETHGLAEHVTGRSHWDGPLVVELAHDLDASLALIAGYIDGLCDAVIVASD